MLKRQIPIRTFEQWNKTTPGFLEADLVAHCGPSVQGTFLYILTLTDIATGWTECFPLRSKKQEEVLSALSQARTLFPFPILGLDADNGCEFINFELLTYCEQQHVTFTRGRPGVKTDQCFVEQKNGAIVRQVTGYDRMTGEHAYHQLSELYQALRLYVNCFQPSMKLQEKVHESRKVHRIYDAAKTPLQRLLLSRLLPVHKEQELERMAKLLDPLRLFSHLQELQQALFGRLPAGSSEAREGLCFCLQRCLTGSFTPHPETEKQAEKLGGTPALISASASKDELGAACFSPVIATNTSVKAGSPEKRTAATRQRTGNSQDVKLGFPMSSADPFQVNQGRRHSSGIRPSPSVISLEQATQNYLEHERTLHRKPKTLEWHKLALGFFQRYVLTEHDGVMIGQITQAQVHGWFAFLQEQPTIRGELRSANTVQSYARSARAFCRWAVQKKYLPGTPFAHLPLPEMKRRSLPLLSPEEWDRLLLACHHPLERCERAELATARNRALLWLLFDTGMQVAELCRLRIRDVDCEQGTFNVRGKGTQARRIMLGQESLRSLLIHLDASRRAGASEKQADVGEEPLFLSETGHPLTQEAVALLFGRLRKRAGITRKGVTASLLRESFALRYLRAGGDVCTLPEMLGQQDCVSLSSLLYRSNEMMEKEKRRECLEDHL